MIAGPMGYQTCSFIEAAERATEVGVADPASGVVGLRDRAVYIASPVREPVALA